MPLHTLASRPRVCEQLCHAPLSVAIQSAIGITPPERSGVDRAPSIFQRCLKRVGFLVDESTELSVFVNVVLMPIAQSPLLKGCERLLCLLDCLGRQQALGEQTTGVGTDEGTVDAADAVKLPPIGHIEY